jgi:hypothetical protein
MDEAVYDDDDDDEVEDELGSEDGHLGRRAYLGSDEDDEEDDDAYMYAALHRGVGAGGGRGGGAGTAGNRADGGNELDAMLVQHMPQVCTWRPSLGLVLPEGLGSLAGWPLLDSAC